MFSVKWSQTGREGREEQSVHRRQEGHWKLLNHDQRGCIFLCVLCATHEPSCNCREQSELCYRVVHGFLLIQQHFLS